MLETNPVASALRQLIARYAVFRDRQPLAIGIAKSLFERHPDLDDGTIKGALRMHTLSTSYLKSVARGGARFDLDGNAIGDVTPDQVAYASEQLKQRFAKKAAAAKAQKEVEKAKQKHVAKLEMLVQRFAKH